MSSASDPFAWEETAYGLQPGTIKMVNRACDEFFKQRGMATGTWRARAQATFAARAAATTHNPQPTTHNPQPTTHNPQPTTHNPQRVTAMPETTEPEVTETAAPEDEVFVLIELALAANALVNAALENEGKQPLSKAVANLRLALGTAQNAGLIETA